MPRAKTLRHSVNTRHNEKIAALVGDHGPAGYGAYWMILEIMHREERMGIEYTEKRMKRLGGQVGMERAAFAQLLEDMIAVYELLAVEDNHLVSTLSYTRRSKPRQAAVIVAPEPTTDETPAEQAPAPEPEDEETKRYIGKGYNRNDIEMHKWLKRMISWRSPGMERFLMSPLIDQSIYICNNYPPDDILAAIDELQENADLRNRTSTSYDAIRRVLDK
ncbi:MAG: DUF4373 domain-containing protein [Sphingobacteriales bacterium]|nr:MAG: DUF4373 domain-containing protein [Sphingobacteriales bacterium]